MKSSGEIQGQGGINGYLYEGGAIGKIQITRNKGT
jgi:hypothetical protein